MTKVNFKCKDKLYKFIEAYSLYIISDEALNDRSKSEIIQNVKHSKAIIINNDMNQNSECEFFILSFYNTIIII